MLARYMLSSSCVCVSVALRYCIKTAKCRSRIVRGLSGATGYLPNPPHKGIQSQRRVTLAVSKCIKLNQFQIIITNRLSHFHSVSTLQLDWLNWWPSQPPYLSIARGLLFATVGDHCAAMKDFQNSWADNAVARGDVCSRHFRLAQDDANNATR